MLGQGSRAVSLLHTLAHGVCGRRVHCGGCRGMTDCLSVRLSVDRLGWCTVHVLFSDQRSQVGARGQGSTRELDLSDVTKHNFNRRMTFPIEYCSWRTLPPEGP
jgi:hypothetical protein